jgi:hypothetical protein
MNEGDAALKKGEGFCNGRFDLIQERRLKQAQRYERRRWQVGHWLAGQWRMIDEPCRCGRNHYAVESRSGLGVQQHCPVAFWMSITFYNRTNGKWNEEFYHSFPMARLVVPIITGG